MSVTKDRVPAGMKSHGSGTPDSYQNTGDSEGKENDFLSPERYNGVNKNHALSTNVESDFFCKYFTN